MVYSVREALKDWVELDEAIHLVAYSIGILSEGERFKKHVYWSANPIGDSISRLLASLEDMGALERRDGEQDYELRWKKDFKPPNL